MSPTVLPRKQTFYDDFLASCPFLVLSLSQCGKKFQSHSIPLVRTTPEVVSLCFGPQRSMSYPFPVPSEYLLGESFREGNRSWGIVAYTYGRMLIHPSYTWIMLCEGEMYVSGCVVSALDVCGRLCQCVISIPLMVEPAYAGVEDQPLNLFVTTECPVLQYLSAKTETSLA